MNMYHRTNVIHESDTCQTITLQSLWYTYMYMAHVEQLVYDFNVGQLVMYADVSGKSGTYCYVYLHV